MIPLLHRNRQVLASVESFFSLLFTGGGETPEQGCPDANRFVPSGPACPTGWVGYERRCYFFSDEERNWTSGQSFCASYNSSLAVIKNETEKVFMLRYKGNAGHWIGLEKDLNQTWKWVDGTELSDDT
ncbi:hypothetical protein lerEdw1_010554 [Lerista edwardsae]|nr:hypothetical protein lerEdw1_010554 [Lerista edwardsae]